MKERSVIPDRRGGYWLLIAVASIALVTVVPSAAASTGTAATGDREAATISPEQVAAAFRLPGVLFLPNLVTPLPSGIRAEYEFLVKQGSGFPMDAFVNVYATTAEARQASAATAKGTLGNGRVFYPRLRPLRVENVLLVLEDGLSRPHERTLRAAFARLGQPISP